MSSTQRKISWGVVLSAITFVLTTQAKGCNTYAAIVQRVTAVEKAEEFHSQEFKDLRDDVRHVNDKLDRLLERAR